MSVFRLLLRWSVVIAISLGFARSVVAEESLSQVTEKGRSFLTNLVDLKLQLLPEYRGAKVYWLFHDNYLASKVLQKSDPAVAQRIRVAIQREGVKRSGKIEILFGEAKKPLPFREFELVDVRRLGDKVIRTEVVTTNEMRGWTGYADLLFLASIADKNKAKAREDFDSAMRMWDGHGFMDAAAREMEVYSTYKLGLALIAAKRFSVRVPDGVLTRLLAMQDADGGFVTDYRPDGTRVGMANVETTCLSILGIEAVERR